ncbi:MAG: GDP-mannose 4,6-dehydratase [Verrucomicrobiae bacterium]|nr:GDP-mannose 4,6-dehydratase [Verrucomicrobiae bacterium]
MRFLVTGGAGFIGSHFCDWALQAGHEVTIIDDFNDFYDPAIKRSNIKGIIRDIHLIEGDIRDKTAVKRAFTEKPVDAVVHIAARAGVRPSIQNPQLYVETNVLGTLNLLEACRELEIKKFIFASTSSIYGVNPKVPFSEDDLVQSTISPYASTKLCCEQLCSNYSRLYGMQINCLRFFTVYGPRQRPDLAIHKFASALLQGKPIDQYGDGTTRRDYTYIEDIISGMVAAVNYDQTPYEIINLGENETTTLKRLIELLEQELGVRAKINQLPDQPGDVPVTYANISKAKRLFGYHPQTKIEAGIKKFVKWLKSSESL